MDKKVIPLMLFALILLPFTSAAFDTLGTYQQSSEITLVQLCDDCNFNNITSVVYPNSSIFISEVPMIADGTQYTFVLNRSLTSPTGTYFVNGFGDDGGTDAVWAYTFEVTSTGEILTTGESMVYVVLSFAVFAFFLISLYFTLVIPYSNKSLTDGQIVGITKTKYIKLGLILITYALFTWFLNILIGLSDNFVSLTMYYGLVTFLFNSLNLLALPLFIIIFVWTLMEIIKDIKLKGLIDKFGSARGKNG